MSLHGRVPTLKSSTLNVILTTRYWASSLITSLTSKSSALWPYQDSSWPELIIPSLAYLLTWSNQIDFLISLPSTFHSLISLWVHSLCLQIMIQELNGNVSSLLLFPGSWVLLEKVAEIYRLVTIPVAYTFQGLYIHGFQSVRPSTLFPKPFT